MPLSDAERDELKTLIREMAKESAEIWWNSPGSGIAMPRRSDQGDPTE